jgi:hypothetical protein
MSSLHAKRSSVLVGPEVTVMVVRPLLERGARMDDMMRTANPFARPSDSIESFEGNV